MKKPKCRPIAELRKLCKMSQKHAAYLMDVSTKSWRKLETGKVAMSNEDWAKFSKFCNEFKDSNDKVDVKLANHERSKMIFDMTKEHLLKGEFDLVQFCKKTGFAHSTVRKLVYTLRDYNLVESEQRSAKGRHRYTIWNVIDQYGLEGFEHRQSKDDSGADVTKEVFEAWGIKFADIKLPSRIYTIAKSHDDEEEE